ncbi:mitochondrial carrier domain-containing protein [Cladochytrium replicatum]|nr:mitochondrial carrier domain-containing protein [Cladochytrium replicatum]
MADKESQGSARQTAKELFAGSVGGIVQVLTGQPFDIVKVRLQTQPKENPVYKGMLDCVTKISKEEGFLAFYKGTLVPLIGIGACVSVQFGALAAAKRFLTNKENTPLSPVQLYLAGSTSGVANSVLSGPIEHVRTRLQVQTSTTGANSYKGPWDFVRKVYGTYGIAGIYKGQAITVLREFQGYGAYFLTYEWLVQETVRRLGKKSRKEVPVSLQCGYGAFAGYALWLTVYPIDSIKSKLQTDAFDLSKKAYKSALDCARITFKADGLAGFYRGFGACMLRAGPVNAATFVAYETTMNMIGR